MFKHNLFLCLFNPLDLIDSKCSIIVLIVLEFKYFLCIFAVELVNLSVKKRK